MTIGRERIRILVIDDSADFRDGVAAWIANEPDLELVGTDKRCLAVGSKIRRFHRQHHRGNPEPGPESP